MLRAALFALILGWLAASEILFFVTQPYLRDCGLLMDLYSSEAAAKVRQVLMPWLSAEFQQ
jgi:hypothetical protein